MTQKEIYKECFNPVKIRIKDTLSQQYVTREVPCGKCYHCQITKVNEWVTRMVINSLYYKNVYFGTLTYKKTNTYEFDQTQPTLSKCNYRGILQFTPLVLRKDHLQKFFKRLRKNTGAKFQYFACGELGGKYGRPHYHFILWTNSIITLADVRKAWTATDLSTGERVSLGDRLELQDLRLEARNIEHSYKYVCKYLQKKSFNFDKLPNKDEHIQNIKRNYRNLYGGFQNSEFTEETKENYIDVIRPFVCCSTRPAIGLQYFEEHKERFAKQDFSLFGLQGKYVFPSYYVRKTKEYICPFKTISTTNDKPTSYANLPTLCTLLHELQDNLDICENLEISSKMPFYRYENRAGIGGEFIEFDSHINPNNTTFFPRKQFEFYDCKTKRTFRLNKGFIYVAYSKKWNYEHEYTIIEVLNMLEDAFTRICSDMLEPFAISRELREKDLNERIHNEFKDDPDPLDEHYKTAEEKWKEYRSDCINHFMSIVDYNQDMYEYIKNQNEF